jgi:cell division protein FtsW (lipid II flippase)
MLTRLYRQCYPLRIAVKTLALAFGLAILLGLVVGALLSYLPWWAIILIAIFALCLIVWALIGLSKKDVSEENIGMIYGDKGYQSLEPNTFKRIIAWLKTH